MNDNINSKNYMGAKKVQKQIARVKFGPVYTNIVANVTNHH